MISILLIAFSLALDAFAVSVSSSVSIKSFRFKDALVLGAYFGVFQFGMTYIGWFLGSALSEYVTRFGSFIAFLLLAAIGIKMVLSSFDEQEICISGRLTHPRMVVFAFATSIDALATGVSFSLISADILLPSVTIGVVAFALSLFGGMLGGRLSGLLQKRACLFGGIALICIGAKILIESL
jgi:putative Mn2+ efflux pump MntP